MPKAFSPREREAIRLALVQAVIEEARAGGLRKVTVDALVSRAHVSKGVFYQFFETKEQAILEAVREEQESARRFLVAAVETPASTDRDAAAKRLIEGLFAVFERFPVFRELARPDAAGELLRGMSPEDIGQEQLSDDLFFQGLYEDLLTRGLLEYGNMPVLLAIPRLVFATEASKETIGLDRYDDLKQFLIASLSSGLEHGELS